MNERNALERVRFRFIFLKKSLDIPPDEWYNQLVS
nr:MAG TPA: hypothetical protein [Caudoviricetes sp.]